MHRSRCSLLFVLVTLVPALLATATASAEQLAYNCEEDICLVDPDNPSDQSRLTETATNERNPVWSPNGGLIAYNGYYPRPGNETWDVFTLNPAEIDPANPLSSEGTAVSETSQFNEEERVDWSPDSTLLAFSSRPQNSANPLKAQALVGRADGAADPVAIGSSNANEGAPHFGPDSSTVAFLREGAVYTAAVNGTGESPLSIGAYGDDWSPDGRYMAGSRFAPYPYGLEITAVDGSGSHELPVPISSSSQLAWSCDSSRIAYVADEEPLDHVRVAPVDGSGPGVQIPLPEGYVAPLGVALSSDGTRVAFGAGPVTSGYRQVFVAPADGSGKPERVGSALENNGEPSWKPGPSCAAPEPPPAAPPAGAGTAPGTAGTGTAGTGTIPATKQPVKLKLVYFRQPVLEPHFMTIAGIDCHAQGGHPTGKVAEICAAAASAYTQGEAPAGQRSWARAKGPKKVRFAAGRVKVPVGKSKKLKLKFTAAGMKLMKPGRTLTLTVKLTTREGSEKPAKSTRTIKLKVPATNASWTSPRAVSSPAPRRLSQVRPRGMAVCVRRGKCRVDPVAASPGDL